MAIYKLFSIRLQMFETGNIWKFGIPDFRKPGHPKIRKSGIPGFRISKFRKSIPDFGILEIRKSEIMEFRNPDCPGIAKNLIFGKSGSPDLPNFRKIRKYDFPDFRRIRKSAFPESQIPGFLKVPGITVTALINWGITSHAVIHYSYSINCFRHY